MSITAIGKLPFSEGKIRIMSESSGGVTIIEHNEILYNVKLSSAFSFYEPGDTLKVTRVPSKRYPNGFSLRIDTKTKAVPKKKYTPPKKPTDVTKLLNAKQLEFYEAVTSDCRGFFTLLGSAGTGKSFTIGQIIQTFHEDDVTLTATTHAAKDVLAQMSKRKTLTTQSALNFKMVKEGYSMNLRQLDNSKIKQSEVLIVDEVSMLPFEVFEAIVKEYEEGTYNKVIFLGDPLQLPSVSKGIDIMTVDAVTVILTEQMRQKTTSKDLKNYLEVLRHTIATDGPIVGIPTLDKIITYSEHKDFCKAYKDEMESKRVLAYRNRVVDKYNEYINSGDDHFNVGDTVVINKPIANSVETLANNGEEVSIINVKDETDTEGYYRLEVMTNSGSSATINHWASASVLERKLKTLEMEGREEDYWAVKDAAFSLKHTYASTVHKAQGKSIKHVFIDLNDIWQAYNTEPSKWAQPISKDLFLRLLYVAISRMETKAHVFIGTVRNYNYLKV